MSIERYQITDGSQGLPIVSRALVHNGVVQLCGVTPDPVGGVKAGALDTQASGS